MDNEFNNRNTDYNPESQKENSENTVNGESTEKLQDAETSDSKAEGTVQPPADETVGTDSTSPAENVYNADETAHTSDTTDAASTTDAANTAETGGAGNYANQNPNSNPYTNGYTGGYNNNGYTSGYNTNAGNTNGTSNNQYYNSNTGDTNNGYANNGYANNPNNQGYGSYNNGYYNNTNGYGSYYQNSQNQNSNGQTNGQTENPYSQYGGNPQYKWNYDDYQKALKTNEKPKTKTRGLKPFIITISSVVAVAVIGLTVYGIVRLSEGGNGSMGTSSSASEKINSKLNIADQPAVASKATGSELTTEQVAEKMMPSVVGVEIYSLSSVEPTAEGTGIVMTSDGYIVTNAHVVNGAQKICVVMSNGKKYETVKLVGQDTKTDLAVLKVNATGLSAATFGNSSQLKVGQTVLAIGNPGGLTFANTVTNGIVSGLNRTVNTSSTATQMAYIQTNALINPGNSGGPLVNMFGQVVGINSAKITATGYEGIGFSIPINSAKPIIDSIVQYGYVKGRVKVGISVYPLSNSQAKWYSYPSGLYVQGIDRSSDAYKKGMRNKDLITEINGVSLANDDSATVYNTFYKEENKYKAGESITVKVYRTQTGSTMTFSIKLEEDKGDTETIDSSASSAPSSNQKGGSSGGSTSDFWSQFDK